MDHIYTVHTNKINQMSQERKRNVSIKTEKFIHLRGFRKTQCMRINKTKGRKKQETDQLRITQNTTHWGD